jgi:hypothetical protein
MSECGLQLKESATGVWLQADRYMIGIQSGQLLSFL